MRYILISRIFMEVSIFHADKVMVMGSLKDSHVFNFVILLKLRKFGAHAICILQYIHLISILHGCEDYTIFRVSTAPGNSRKIGNLLEFDIRPGNTGNLLKFNWSSWKIAKCWRESCEFSASKLLGWHSDERWSELIITCSVRDSSYIGCRRNISNQAVTT